MSSEQNLVMLQTTLHKKKTLFNVVLILLGQHYTHQNLMQCCPRCSRQHCIRKIQKCCFKTPGTRLHRKNSMQYCPRRSKQHCTGQNQVNVVHSVYLYISGPLRQINIELSFLYYRNRLTS